MSRVPDFVMDRQKPDKIKRVTAAETLDVNERVVIATVDGANYNITLPPVAEAAGFIFTIIADVASAHAATIVDKGDDSRWIDLALNVDEEYVILYSTGDNWLILSNGRQANIADPDALTAGALTDNTAGSANTTLEALVDGSTYANDVAAIRNNFADLAAQHNKLLADVTSIRTKLVALIDVVEKAQLTKAS